MSELLKLFKEGEELQSKMREIFKENELEISDLRYLPKDDFELWLGFYEQSIVLTKKISFMVNNNKF